MFRVGDIVECVDDGGYPYLTVGKNYTVSVSDNANHCVGIGGSIKTEYYSYRFKLVGSSPILQGGAEEYDEAMAADALING